MLKITEIQLTNERQIRRARLAYVVNSSGCTGTRPKVGILSLLTDESDDIGGSDDDNRGSDDNCGNDDDDGCLSREKTLINIVIDAMDQFRGSALAQDGLIFASPANDQGAPYLVIDPRFGVRLCCLYMML